MTKCFKIGATFVLLLYKSVSIIHQQNTRIFHHLLLSYSPSTRRHKKHPSNTRQKEWIFVSQRCLTNQKCACYYSAHFFYMFVITFLLIHLMFLSFFLPLFWKSFFHDAGINTYWSSQPFNIQVKLSNNKISQFPLFIYMFVY